MFKNVRRKIRKISNIRKSNIVKNNEIKKSGAAHVPIVFTPSLYVSLRVTISTVVDTLLLFLEDQFEGGCWISMAMCV